MAEIINPHIWYPGGYPGTCYDMREVVTWYPKPGYPTIAVARFVADTVATVEFTLADFEAAKQNSLDNGG